MGQRRRRRVHLLLIAALTALADDGRGRLSVDGDRLQGPFWALALLGARIAGSYLATRRWSTRSRRASPSAEPIGRFTRVEEPVGTR